MHSVNLLSIYFNHKKVPVTMPKCKQLSVEEKISIIGRVKHAGASKLVVAKSMKRSWKAIHNCIKHHDATGGINSKPGRGWKPLLDDDACKCAYEMLTSGKFAGAGAVAREMYKQGKTTKQVSRTTIISSVRSYCKDKGLPGITAASTRPRKKLTAEQKEARLRFCLDNRKTDWRRVMFTDRCKFHHYYPKVKVVKCAWRRVGVPTEEYKVNKAATYNIYAGITPYGSSKVHVVAGTTNFTPKKVYRNQKGEQAKSITIDAYHDVVKETLLPEGCRLMGTADWVLQQDNDPTHKKGSASALKEYNDESGGSIQLIRSWPPHSPDLSPIENVWSWVQQQVNVAGCNTTAEFQAKVREVFDGLSLEYLEKLYSSMPKRIEQCIARGGDRIRY